MKTPDVKERIIASLDNLEPQKARELVNTLFWSDSAFSFGMLGQLPRGLNFSVAFLDELARQLQNIPPHLLREFVAEMGRNIDYGSIKTLPGAYAPVLAALGLALNDDPEKIHLNRERKISFFRKAIKSADFGKIRTTIIRQAEINSPVVENSVAVIVSDPVIFANLVNILPPLLNSLLRVTARTLEEIDFPPEILASAVFNLISDLEAEQLGAIINRFSSLVNDLHEGSAILGCPEPRFRQVARELLEKIVGQLDPQATASLLTVMGEDIEIFISAFADTMQQKPQLLAEMLPAFIRSMAAGLRGLTYLLGQLEALPDQSYKDIWRDWEDEAFHDAAMFTNALLRLINRILAEDPIFLEKTMALFIRTLDQTALTDLLNNTIKFYNIMHAEDEKKAFSCLEGLDQDQLAQAIKLTSSKLSQTLAENPRLSRAFLKAAFRVFGGFMRGLFNFSVR